MIDTKNRYNNKRNHEPINALLVECKILKIIKAILLFYVVKVLVVIQLITMHIDLIVLVIILTNNTNLIHLILLLKYVLLNYYYLTLWVLQYNDKFTNEPIENNYLPTFILK